MKTIISLFLIMGLALPYTALSYSYNVEDLVREAENILSEDFFDFEKCIPTADVPDNSTDIVRELLLGRNDLSRMLERRCLKNRIEKSYKQICTTREKLLKNRYRTQDESTRTYLDSQISRLDQIQWKFNKRMNTLAQRSDKILRKINKKDEAWFTGFYRTTDEIEAYRNIFDVNSYNQCEDDSESQL